MKKIYFPIFLMIFFSVFGYAYGQLDTSTNSSSLLDNGKDTVIFLSYLPKHPTPNQSVTVTASSFQTNLEIANASWYLNGNLKLSGVGKTSFTFTTGSVGEESVVAISVETTKFGTVTKEITINPTDLDILWEADTYVPPFYRGKALPSSQSNVRVIPFPSFASRSGYYDTKDLIYKWKEGYFGSPEDSGYGKNTFIYKTGYTYNSDPIDVTVTTSDASLSINKKISIYVSEPKIVFYENKPLESIRYENGLNDTFQFTNSELVVHASPYFFAIDGLNNNGAIFSWKMDGKKLEIDPDNKTEFTFRKPEQGQGKFQLNLSIDNTGYDLQSASKNVSISYSN